MVRDRHYFRQTVITLKSQPEGSSFWGNRTILSNLPADSTHLKPNRNKNIGSSTPTESLSIPHLHIKICRLASVSLHIEMPQSFGCQKGWGSTEVKNSGCYKKDGTNTLSNATLQSKLMPLSKLQKSCQIHLMKLPNLWATPMVNVYSNHEVQKRNKYHAGEKKMQKLSSCFH